MNKRQFFFGGGVKAEVTGFNIERFFNIAAQRSLHVCEIGREPKTGTVTFWTNIRDFKRMKPVAKKANVRLKIRGKYGLPFFLYKNRGRKLLAAGFVSFFLMLYALSFFIWDISFEGNHRFTDETLLHFMETLPVAYGMKKSDISCEWLESQIRNQFTEITWVSAEITGTRLIIRIRENDVLLAPTPRDTTPCDLAAARDGKIVRTVTRSGFCQVKAGDEVKAGDLLVDGTIPIYDDAETLVNVHEIHADAEIFAETVYTYEKRLPAARPMLARTGKARRGFFAELFGHSVYILPPSLGESDWEFITEEKQLKLFDDFYLPVYGGFIRAYEYIPYEKAYEQAEVERLALQEKEDYMKKLSEKGIQILKDDDKITRDASGWRITGHVTVIEDIAKEIPIPDIQTQQQEENQTLDEHH